MRMIRRLRREEDGAVLLVVALSLVVLVGMSVLAVDLGRMVADRRSLVRSADSAVLAAAQQCAMANGEAAAVAAADANAGLNQPGVVRTAWEIDAEECDDASLDGLHGVHVGYEHEMELFFAPIFGFDSATVGGSATAVWGPAQNASMTPITVDFDTLTACGIPLDMDGGGVQPCTLEYAQDTLQNPRWGELDLSEWGNEFAADDPGSCHVSASDLTDAIEGGGVPAPPDVPLPTWVCFDNGLSDSVWEAMEGRYLTFPVMDLDLSTGEEVPNNDSADPDDDCTGADIPDLQTRRHDCRIDTAHIIGFVCLYVVDVSKHGADLTVETEWRGVCTSGGLPCLPDADCYDFGVHAVRLVD